MGWSWRNGSNRGSVVASDSRVALEISALHKSFSGHLGIGRRKAVEGLDLTIRCGEIFGLLGPNGAGKTTTIKMILGLLRPDAGEIRIFGLPHAGREARARIGYLPENPYFYEYLTAREFLDFYARLQGIPARDRRDLITRTLDRVGLSERADTALRKFSKGMTQRLGLAQAIQHEPDLVIFDEPMSGLDPLGRREVRDLILGLRDAGKTVFFSSHILQDAEMICDRVAILQSGTLRSVGGLKEMISNRVRWFEVTVRGDLPAGVDAGSPAGREDEHLLRVADVEALRELLDRLHRSGGQVLSVWPRRETLEDLFMERVGAAVPREDGHG